MAKLSSVAILVTCAFLIRVTIISSDFLFYHSAPHIPFGFLASQAIAYLLYPLLGWISDVYFTRYNVLRLAFIILIAGSVLFVFVTSAGLFGDFSELHQRWLIIAAGVGALILCRAGLGLFEANAIQFGMDQLLEASSDQLGTFIHWYYWSLSLGRLATYLILGSVLIYYSECQIRFDMSDPKWSYDKYNYKIYYTCLFGIGVIQVVSAILGLLLLVFNKKRLNIEVASHNPLKLVYQVLKYSWRHTCPENRSAFTYWEEDIPPRIDLGKNKYGGPFTTEEVEDTKAFLRIILLLITLVGFYLSSHGSHFNQSSERLMKSECPSFWILILIYKPIFLTMLIIVIGIPLYQLVRQYSWFCQKNFPNMLKRMGLGLLCCLAKEIIELTLQATQRNQHYCRMRKNEPHPDPALHCYYLRSKIIDALTGNCSDIATISDGEYYCTQHNLTFLLLIIPYVLHGLAYLLVFMTALEFICAQAPLRLKGILIGIWYAMLVVHLVVVLSETKIIDNTTWELFQEIKAFLIAMSFFAFLYVSKRYRYRVRDEVVNEQFLVEEIYEREIHLAEEYEKEKKEEMRSMFGQSSRQLHYSTIEQ